MHDDFVSYFFPVANLKMPELIIEETLLVSSFLPAWKKKLYFAMCVCDTVYVVVRNIVDYVRDQSAKDNVDYVRYPIAKDNVDFVRYPSAKEIVDCAGGAEC